MNGENQPQQNQHSFAERMACVETAIRYQDKMLALILDEMRTGFARIDTKLDRADARFERLQDQRNKDFRILLGISTATALGTIGLIFKVFVAL
ncbi:MAG TPA: hypothetical protein VFF16_17395 [Telluria sp.]|nr:hypothetical protein [Telluria sp.]